MEKIIVQDTEITVLSHNDKDYISLTDMANGKQDESRAADVIKNWIRTRYTIEFLGTWEMIHNPNFKVVEFDHFRMRAGLPNFTLSASEWIERTNAIGIIVKKGRYGGTYAFKDIAFEFGTAISVTFKTLPSATMPPSTNSSASRTWRISARPWSLATGGTQECRAH